VGKSKFDEIIFTPLQRIQVTGGNVLRALKSDEVGYSGFKEAYFSEINAGAIKAWKLHTKMIMNLIVPVGQVRFVFFYKNQENTGSFKSYILGEDNYARITVPPGIWFAFQGLGTSRSLILNISNIEHDSNEVERKLLEEIEFEW
jgi:dTDP-4-dehydrorhamnose 3,5-epimerase